MSCKSDVALIIRYRILTVIKFVVFIPLLKKTLYRVQPRYISSILHLEFPSKLTWAKQFSITLHNSSNDYSCVFLNYMTYLISVPFVQVT